MPNRWTFVRELGWQFLDDFLSLAIKTMINIFTETTCGMDKKGQNFLRSLHHLWVGARRSPRKKIV